MNPASESGANDEYLLRVAGEHVLSCAGHLLHATRVFWVTGEHELWIEEAKEVHLLCGELQAKKGRLLCGAHVCLVSEHELRLYFGKCHPGVFRLVWVLP